MQVSNAQLAKQDKSSEPRLIRLITSSKLWPLHQDHRAKAPEIEPSESEFDRIDRKEPNLDLAGPAEASARGEELPVEAKHERRLRFIEEHYKNGLLEQKLETMKALLNDMTRQRDSWQAQAERSLSSFQETQQELLRFVRQVPERRKERSKRRFFGLFKKPA